MSETANASSEPGNILRSTISKIGNYFSYPLRVSHYVELMNPLWTTHKLQARVVEVWDETKDSRTITLKPGPNWRLHRAGQHVRIGVPIDGRQYTRTYTISSAPDQTMGTFKITTKVIDGGRVSRYLVRDLKVGDYLPVGLPQGDFYLPDASPIQPLFITAGSGITPAMSMVRSMVAQEKLPDTVHIHYAPHEFDVIFGKELRKLDSEREHYHFHEVHTREFGDKKQTKGHFSLKQLEAICPDWKERDCYACGPPALLADLEKTFKKAGLQRNLHIERFRADFAPVPKDVTGGKVRFTSSQQEFEADSQTSLLRAAEDAGFNPPHGCRMGICHTCQTKLVSGVVRDMRSGELLNESGATVLTCVCAAAGDCELEH